VIAAVVCAAQRVAYLRGAMAMLKPRASRKLHWHDLSQRPLMRQQALDSLNLLPLKIVVAIRVDVAGSRPERLRRMCMESLVMTLDKIGVGKIVAESRGPADDLRDIEHFVAMQSRRIPGASIRLAHIPGPEDPALWSADAVAGAVATAIKGDDSYLARLNRVTLVQFGP